MTKEELIQRFLNDYTEDEILERVQEAKWNYIDQEDLEEYDDDLDEAYMELGRGEAESQVLQEVMSPLDGNCEIDLYCEIHDALCDAWNLSTN